MRSTPPWLRPRRPLDGVGAAARDLAALLHPHFVREEEIALPPLGLLAPLASGDRLPEGIVSGALAMTDALRSELPRMLEEHRGIRAAVQGLRDAAREERAAQHEHLAEQLALHAQTEEEVLIFDFLITRLMVYALAPIAHSLCNQPGKTDYA